MKKFKKVLALVLTMSMLFTLCACGEAKGVNEPSVNSDLPLAGKSIAYILNVASSDIFQMAVSSSKETAEALGMTVDVYFTDTDNVKFQDYVHSCANKGYDAMFLSHGNQETSLELVKMLQEKGIEVVLFDTKLMDPSGNAVSLDGVTQMFQDDQGMAKMTLDYLISQNPERTAAGEPVRVLKIWRGPGISPFDRRNETYTAYEKEGKIETVGGQEVAPLDPTNPENSMREVFASVLAKYPEGSVDAVWSVYDAYGRGAYQAMVEASRTDIPMASVDISNQDINYMLSGNGIWQACATVDFGTIGEQGVRILAMKLHGDETESVYNLTPSLITYDMINSDSTVLNLGESVEGYGVNHDHIADWMAEYIK